MLELKRIKVEEAHIRLVIIPSFLYGKYLHTIDIPQHYNNRIFTRYLSLCLYNDDLCYLIYSSGIRKAFNDNNGFISFDVVLKDVRGDGLRLNTYENITNISHEYDMKYISELSHGVDVNDNIHVTYERLTKKTKSESIVQKQLAEFAAMQREYKLDELMSLI